MLFISLRIHEHSVCLALNRENDRTTSFAQLPQNFTGVLFKISEWTYVFYNVHGYLLYHRFHCCSHTLIHPLAFMRHARRTNHVIIHVEVQLAIFDQQIQK